MNKIINQFLNQNGYADVSSKDIELQMKIHPHYPSFKMITDTLDYFGIENAAVKVPLSILPELPESFLTTFVINNQEEVVLVKKLDDYIIIIGRDKKEKISYEDFKKDWNPNVIIIEKNTNRHFSFSSTRIFFATCAVCSLGLVYWSDWGTYRSVFFGLLVLGFILCVLALREELGYTSDKLNKFCYSVSSSCSEVIEAGKGKLFGNTSFSIAGVTFFSSLLVYSSFLGLNTVLLIPLVFAVFCGLYSLYLQVFVIRKWCLLCNSVILVVFIMAGTAGYFIGNDIRIENIIFLLLISATTYLVVNKIFQLEKENKKLITDTYSLNRFKRDPEIFQFLYKAAPPIVNRNSIKGEIILGDPNGDFEIYALTNPYCGHCKKAFESYLKILMDIKSNLKIRLRFLVNTKDITSPVVLICMRLHELYNEFGAEKVEEAYSEWFRTKDAEIWLTRFGKPAQGNGNHKETLLKQREWAVNEGFYYTPTTIINGHPYPLKYGYNELLFFTKELFDQRLKDTKSNVQPNLI